MTQASITPTLVLSVPDLSVALDDFMQRLGFRLEMILPADAPHTAIISRQGVTWQLQAPALPMSAVESSKLWHEGRAGMQYRDLIPNRLGGRVVASHIRIPDGGEVLDYVHYHNVCFQMIYCRAGWVRVVYEDQGQPFVMQAGDCVLQPPEIRHRVLEASPGLEVIEVSCPAIHETWVEHELSLPTEHLSPERVFNGQCFVWHRASQTQWTTWQHAGWIARDTRIAAATNGLADVQIVRATAETITNIDRRTRDFFVFVLHGESELQCGEAGKRHIQASDSCIIPAELTATLHASAGLEMLIVSLPAKA
jgi:quercetin dioxygenase-like cupin family protein